MSNCPYCQTPIVEEYYFCVGCERQVKCRSCDGLLLANKTRCLRCGAAIVDTGTAQSQMNEYSLEEKQNSDSSSRSIHVRATDNAITSLAPLLGLSPQQTKIISVAPSKNTTPLTTLPQLQEPTNEQKEQPTSEENVQNFNLPEKPVARHKWEEFFVIDDDGNLIVISNDYKGKLKKDQQNRFIIMYSWAYQQAITEKNLSKDNIYAAAKKAGLYDPNFFKYISDVTREYMYGSDLNLKLKSNADNLILEIIKDMEDDSKKGFPYWKGSSRSGNKRLGLSREDKKKVDSWIGMELSLGEIDIRNLGSAGKYGMVAIWILTKKLKVLQAVKPILAFEFLKKKFTTIPISAKGFTRALSREENGKFFLRNTDGLYYITEEAEKKVLSWIEGESVQNGIGFENDSDDDSDDEGDE